MSGGGLGDKVAVGTWRIHVNAEKRTRNSKAASPEWLDAAGKLGGSGEKEM